MLCAWISFPVQYYVVFERVEKWISRRIVAEKQRMWVFGARWALVILSCKKNESKNMNSSQICVLKFLNRNHFSPLSSLIISVLLAELIPRLALFIALVGAFSAASVSLVFPPILDLLVCYARGRISPSDWARNCSILAFGVLGTVTGTYAAVHEIVSAFGENR